MTGCAGDSAPLVGPCFSEERAHRTLRGCLEHALCSVRRGHTHLRRFARIHRSNGARQSRASSAGAMAA